jgi:hypothetical protein
MWKTRLQRDAATISMQPTFSKTAMNVSIDCYNAMHVSLHQTIQFFEERAFSVTSLIQEPNLKHVPNLIVCQLEDFFSVNECKNNMRK